MPEALGARFCTSTRSPGRLRLKSLELSPISHPFPPKDKGSMYSRTAQTGTHPRTLFQILPCGLAFLLVRVGGRSLGTLVNLIACRCDNLSLALTKVPGLQHLGDQRPGDQLKISRSGYDQKCVVERDDGGFAPSSTAARTILR